MSSTVTLPIHAGTHLDAPVHYVDGGESVERFPLELALVEAWVVDLTHVGANRVIAVDDLAAGWPETPPPAVLLRTEWPEAAFETDRFWADSPVVGDEAAEWLAAQEIRLVGYDFPQEEAIKDLVVGRRPVSLEDFTLHHAILSRGIWQIEYLINLHRLTSQRVTLIVSPLPLVGLDGSPVRVLARCHE